MPKYRIIYGTDYLKDLKKIVKSGDKKIVNKAEKIIEKLKTDPHRKRSGVDIKLISSSKDAVYRVRIGKYRMVYEIDETEKKIFLTMIFLKTSDKDYRKR
jgi:addiction module RelE/StbE family toxin